MTCPPRSWDHYLDYFQPYDDQSTSSEWIDPDISPPYKPQKVVWPIYMEGARRVLYFFFWGESEEGTKWKNTLSGGAK